MDPVSGSYFWREEPSPAAMQGIKLLFEEFGGPNLIELTEQCRVADKEFYEEVLLPLRTTDKGPTERGLDILQSRVIRNGDIPQLDKQGTRLLAYCNAQKCDHMRSRAQRFAMMNNQRLYWSVACDSLSGLSARKAFADTKDWKSLGQQKANWLTYDDKRTGRRLGFLPLCKGMPVYLDDHLNRPKGVIAGTRGVITDIWFDGSPPTKPNSDGEYVCRTIPLAVLVKFEGFDKPIPVGRTSNTWRLKRSRTSPAIRRLQIPLQQCP